MPLRPLGRHCGEGSPSGWPAPDGLLQPSQGQLLRPSEGSEQRGERSQLLVPLRASEVLKKILQLPRRKGWGKPSLASQKSEEEKHCGYKQNRISPQILRA